MHEVPVNLFCKVRGGTEVPLQMLTETSVPKRKESDTPRARRQFSKEMQSEKRTASGSHVTPKRRTASGSHVMPKRRTASGMEETREIRGCQGMSGRGDECAAENEKMKEK